MKTSLKTLAKQMQPEPPPLIEPPPAPSYAKAATRAATRQISGHYPAEDVQAFRILAAQQDMDVQELLAEALNMAFEKYGLPNRIPITSGRRTKREPSPIRSTPRRRATPHRTTGEP